MPKIGKYIGVSLKQHYSYCHAFAFFYFTFSFLLLFCSIYSSQPPPAYNPHIWQDIRRQSELSIIPTPDPFLCDYGLPDVILLQNYDTTQPFRDSFFNIPQFNSFDMDVYKINNLGSSDRAYMQSNYREDTDFSTHYTKEGAWVTFNNV